MSALHTAHKKQQYVELRGHKSLCHDKQSSHLLDLGTQSSLSSGLALSNLVVGQAFWVVLWANDIAFGRRSPVLDVNCIGMMDHSSSGRNKRPRVGGFRGFLGHRESTTLTQRSQKRARNAV